MTALTGIRADIPWPAQDLGSGTIGSALLAIERAHLDLAPWDQAHTALALCTRSLNVDDRASLYYGVPAVAFALNAAAGTTSRYARALDQLDTAVTAVTRRRLDLANRRIDTGQHTTASEFDLLYGLTGIGVQLLARHGDCEQLRSILAYLVRLTLPHPDGLPGWWTDLDPSGRHSEAYPGGHGNTGTAHGICGPLALLSQAALHGITVEGHTEAIIRIRSWLDSIRCWSPGRSWWPEWITLHNHLSHEAASKAPTRPSWCYGLPGQTRALQLAALALGDPNRRRAAEDALLAGLSDPAYVAQLSESGLCHGVAGTLQTTRHVAADCAEPARFDQVLDSLRVLLDEVPATRTHGLLRGSEGADLARLADQHNGHTQSGWDACLLASVRSPR